MSANFPSRPREDYWFSLGRLNMTSTLVVVLLGAFSMVVSVFFPPTPGLVALLAFIPDAVFSGEVWRLFTWPLANGMGLWPILTLVMLWYFGRDLESRIGRNTMARFFLGIWVSLTLAASLIGVMLPDAVLVGLSLVQFAILLVWIAENPRRPFFFGIPAWVLGSVLLAVQALQMVGGRMWGSFFVLLFGLVGVAFAARRVGLLTHATFIPAGTPHKKRSTRSTKQQPTRTDRRHTSDEDRMDALLAKISAEGIHSLSKAERAELEKLRQRRRR